MNDDIPLPLGLPDVSRFQAANDCFQAWTSHLGLRVYLLSTHSPIIRRRVVSALETRSKPQVSGVGALQICAVMVHPQLLRLLSLSKDLNLLGRHLVLWPVRPPPSRDLPPS